MQHTVSGPRRGTTRLATGPQLHYTEQGDLSGEAIVFIHGWPDSSYSFSRVLALLELDRYHTFAVDLRGFGDSERPADGSAMEDFAADVVAFLDAVGVERATVVGHSFGSFVARRVAQAHPERVARLVLIGSAVTADNDVLREVQDIVRTLEDPVSEEFTREFQSSTIHAPVPEAFFEGLIAESLKLPARLWRSALDALMASDDADELGRMVTPTLLLWGEHDALFSRQDQEELLAAIPGARLIVYPDAGHCPNWECPEKVAATLNAFARPTASA